MIVNAGGGKKNGGGSKTSARSKKKKVVGEGVELKKETQEEEDKCDTSRRVEAHPSEPDEG